jgi:hypothetical protein
LSLIRANQQEAIDNYNQEPDFSSDQSQEEVMENFENVGPV